LLTLTPSFTLTANRYKYSPPPPPHSKNPKLGELPPEGTPFLGGNIAKNYGGGGGLVIDTSGGPGGLTAKMSGLPQLTSAS